MNSSTSGTQWPSWTSAPELHTELSPQVAPVNLRVQLWQPKGACSSSPKILKESQACCCMLASSESEAQIQVGIGYWVLDTGCWWEQPYRKNFIPTEGIGMGLFPVFTTWKKDSGYWSVFRTSSFMSNQVDFYLCICNVIQFILSL